MTREKAIPIRGIKQDWYGDKEQEILENYKEYARTSIKNNLLGSPDFKQYESFLVKSQREEDIPAKATDEKQHKNEDTLIHEKESKKN